VGVVALTDLVEKAMNKGFPAGMLALDRLESGRVEWSGRLPADRSIWDLDDVALIADPEVDLSIDPMADGGFRVQGRLRAPVELECRRCLEGIARTVEIDFDLRFDPEIGLDEESDGLYRMDPDGRDLELLPALREELLLALPEFPLCKPDCRGICSICGENRNEGDCGCQVESADARWDELRNRFPREPGAAKGPGSGSDDG